MYVFCTLRCCNKQRNVGTMTSIIPMLCLAIKYVYVHTDSLLLYMYTLYL